MISNLQLNEMKDQVGLMETRNDDVITYDDFEASFFKQTGDGIRSNADQFSLASFGRKGTLDSRNRDEIKRIEREKKEQVEVCIF